MSIGKICQCDVITAKRDCLISNVAQLMKQYNVGDIVITNNNEAPVGIITDRDIAIKIVADGVNSKDIYAKDVMSNELLILKHHQSIQETIDMMSAKNIRRAPIVDEQNHVCGIVSIDDLIILLADELNGVARIVYKQVA